MELRPDNIMATAMKTENLKEEIALSGGRTYSPLDAGFSPVVGIDHVGAVHQRVLETDPGSARSSLKAFSEQLDWLQDSLGREARSFQAQEDANSRGM